MFLTTEGRRKSPLFSLFRQEIAALFVIDRHLDFFHDGEHVLPKLAFFRIGGSQEKRWRFRDAKRNRVPFVPSTSQGIERCSRFAESLRNGGAESDKHLGANDFQFVSKNRHKRDHFRESGIAVVGRLVFHGRTILHQVRDVDLAAAEAHRLENFIQLFADGTGEG